MTSRLLIIISAIFLLSSCKNEKTLEIIGAAASLFDKTEKQAVILMDLFHRTKRDPEIESLLQKTAVDIHGKNFSAKNLFFVLTSQNKDQFIALFIEPRAGPEYLGYMVRGATYKGRWYLERVYNLLSPSTSGRTAQEDFMIQIFTDINYFESRSSLRLNSEFWNDNWRVFKRIKAADAQYADYAGTFDFIAGYLKEHGER